MRTAQLVAGITLLTIGFLITVLNDLLCAGEWKGRSMAEKRGAARHKTSATRASALRGRKSERKGQRSIPRQAKIVGLERRVVNPDLRPWPSDVVQIVASTPEKINIRGLRGRVVSQVCADCARRILVDTFTILTAWEMPERERRPLRFICADCCRKYDTSGIKTLIDLRRAAADTGDL